MRIVAGRLKGRRLSAPRGVTTRPTSDRLRQTLFDILAHRFDDAVAGSRVLDLFSGTGALGLEALSRGGDYALFVEADAAARGALRSNIEALGLTGATRLYRRDATQLGSAGNIPPFDLVFADPPYGLGLGERALAGALGGGWVKPGAVVVLEERADADLGDVPGLAVVKDRRIGDSRLRFFNAQPVGSEAR